MPMYVTPTSGSKRKTALILCIFFGMFGFHYFYVGRIGKGIFYLFTFGFFLFGWFFDIFKILLGDFRDKYGFYLKEW